MATVETVLIERKAADITRDALGMAVADAATYENAAHMLLCLAAVRAEIDSTFDPVIASAHVAHKQALAAKAGHADPVKAAERHLKSAMGTWREAEERRAREEAERIEAEQRAQREAAAFAAAQELALSVAIEAARDEGVEVDPTGIAEELMRSQPQDISAPVVARPCLPDVAGISGRTTWKAQVTDLAALVRAVAAGQVPITAIQANDVFLGQQARSLKSLLNYPGVRVYSEGSVAVRR